MSAVRRQVVFDSLGLMFTYLRFNTASPSYSIARRCVSIGVCAFVIGNILLLNGCASTTRDMDQSAGLTVPTAWSIEAGVNSPSATSLVQWWERFNDPLLTSLVLQSMQRNTDVQAASAALRQARALRDVAAGALLPVVAGSASAQHGTSGTNSTGNSFKLGADASWEIDVFGGNRSALAASEASATAAAANLGNVQISIGAEVALSYITLRNAQARLEIAEANLMSQTETAQITQWRLQAGLVSSLEDAQARAAVAQTQAQLPVLQIAIDQTQRALAVLTGQPPAALLQVLTGKRPIPIAAPDLALSLPTETLRQRPDVRAAEYSVTAASARVAQADAARMPSFKLNGSLGLNALTLGRLTHGAALVNALLGGVSVPIFNGGVLSAQVRAQEAALQQAQATHRGTILTALKDVENALIALRGDRERLTRLTLASEAANDAALYARQRYSSGIVDFQTVLETQRTQLNTQDSVASVTADIAADHVRLYKALGGGWQPDLVAVPTHALPL